MRIRNEVINGVKGFTKTLNGFEMAEVNNNLKADGRKVNNREREALMVDILCYHLDEALSTNENIVDNINNGVYTDHMRSSVLKALNHVIMG